MEPSDEKAQIEQVIREAKDLVKMLEATSVRRVRLAAGRFRIEIERAFAEGGLMATVVPAAEAVAPSKGESLHHVLAPLVGTFYRAPNPGAKPFVEAGSHVQRGQLLGIIEVMKVMNEVTSDVSGTVVEVLVQNGQPVQYEQPLMSIDTSTS